jgi:hypothetical protein
VTSILFNFCVGYVDRQIGTEVKSKKKIQRDEPVLNKTKVCTCTLKFINFGTNIQKISDNWARFFTVVSVLMSICLRFQAYPVHYNLDCFTSV